MPVERQALALITLCGSVALLCGWVALWWCAVRIVCGRRLGPIEWVPVAVLAFYVPHVVIGHAAVSGEASTAGILLAAWGVLALTIDVVGVSRWLYRRQSRRAAEQDASRGTDSDSRAC